MNGYEKLVKIMRSEGSRGNDKTYLKIGVMTSDKTCNIGALELESDDLLIGQHLYGYLDKGDDVLVAKLSSQKYIIIEKVVDI